MFPWLDTFQRVNVQASAFRYVSGSGFNPNPVFFRFNPDQVSFRVFSDTYLSRQDTTLPTEKILRKYLIQRFNPDFFTLESGSKINKLKNLSFLIKIFQLNTMKKCQNKFFFIFSPGYFLLVVRIRPISTRIHKGGGSTEKEKKNI